MLRNALSSIILLAMIIHCAGRIGVLSYVYKKRHLIEYSIGLIAEIPIAICGSDFDPNKGLTALTVTNDDGALPASTVAQEINLFFDDAYLPGYIRFQYLQARTLADPSDLYKSTSGKSIFHPPLI